MNFYRQPMAMAQSVQQHIRLRCRVMASSFIPTNVSKQKAAMPMEGL
jgi:hypothetical protein